MPASTPLAELLSLHGRTALVTGAGSGIGRAVALRLAEAGADLELLDCNRAALEQLAQELSPYGRRVGLHAVDLARKSAIDALWDGLSGSPPGILVNNAAVYPTRHFSDMDEGFWKHLMAVNLEAVVWMCQRMIRARGQQGGVIVNIGSVEAVLPFKEDLSAYSTSKAGVIALTRALAREHARKGFRINALLPGGTHTPGTRSMARRIARLQLGLLKTGYDYFQRLPAGRMADPDEIARMVLVLCSDLASYVHGAAVPVDGGFLSA